MPTILIRYCHSEIFEIFRILEDFVLWPYFEFFCILAKGAFSWTKFCQNSRRLCSVTLFWIFLHFGKRGVLLNQILLLWTWKQYVISRRFSNTFEQLLLWKPENWFAYWIIKVKWSRYRPGVAQRVGRDIALVFHDRGPRRGWVVSSTPQPHFTPGKDPVPILQKAGWAPGPVCTGGKSRPHRDSIPDRAARSSVAIPTELPGTLLDNKNTKFKTSYIISNLTTVICRFSEKWSLQFCALYWRSTLVCICLQNRSIQKKGGSILDLWLPVLCSFVKWTFGKKKPHVACCAITE